MEAANRPVFLRTAVVPECDGVRGVRFGHMRSSPRSLLVLSVGLLFALTACGHQDSQAREGDGWRWLATTAAFDETFLLYIDSGEELDAFWQAAAAGIPPPDTGLPDIDFDEEFVLVLSTRGRGSQPAPCGVYFRGLRVDREERTLTVLYEPDNSQEFCDAAYAYGQYVVAVERGYAGEPPLSILIDEPGQAGQPVPLTVDP